MDKSAEHIVSRARKVVRHVFRKRKRARLPKTSSRETAFSVNVLPPKLKRSSLDNVDIRSELYGADEQKNAADLADLGDPELKIYWRGRETRSLEDLHITRTTAKKMVELQLDNDRLCREVRDFDKKLKDVNRQLKQEREFNEEQRWTYIQEIRATIKETSTVSTQTREYIDSDDEDDDALVNELRRVRDMFYKQRDICCRLSEKFLKIRDDRDRLQTRMKRLEMVYSTVIDELLKHIAEVRVYFASIRKGVLLERSAVASLVDRNAKLGYNNAILQLEILKYEKKLETYQNQTVDFTDGHEVEKFLARCRSSKLLTASGGGGDTSSVKLTRKGSFINVPVAVINGDRIETKLTPLFSIVGLANQHSGNPESDHVFSNVVKPAKGRRTRSVPSKVWRIKYETKPNVLRMHNRRILSEPGLGRKSAELEGEGSASENSDRS